MLEYYEGIMILTSNRVQSLDPAFESRIDHTILFRALDKNSRKAIWQMLLEKNTAAQSTVRDRRSGEIVSAVESNVETTIATTAKKDEAGSQEEEEEEEETNLVKLMFPHVLTARDIEKLSKLKLDGRKIRNVLKSAQLLAGHRGEDLGYDHIMKVMDETQDLYTAAKATNESRAAMFSAMFS